MDGVRIGNRLLCDSRGIQHKAIYLKICLIIEGAGLNSHSTEKSGASYILSIYINFFILMANRLIYIYALFITFLEKC